MVCPGEMLLPSIKWMRAPVDPEHGVAFSEQTSGEDPTEAPCNAGDENFHDASFEPGITKGSSSASRCRRSTPSSIIAAIRCFT